MAVGPRAPGGRAARLEPPHATALCGGGGRVNRGGSPQTHLQPRISAFLPAVLSFVVSPRDLSRPTRRGSRDARSICVDRAATRSTWRASWRQRCAAGQDGSAGLQWRGPEVSFTGKLRPPPAPPFLPALLILSFVVSRFPHLVFIFQFVISLPDFTLHCAGVFCNNLM